MTRSSISPPPSEPRDEAPAPAWRRRVRRAVHDHVYSDLSREVGGFLLGTVDADDGVAIVTAHPAARAESATASLTFTHEAWEDVHSAIEKDGRDLRIVGWYHSHPGFGVFLSPHDLFIHRNF